MITSPKLAYAKSLSGHASIAWVENNNTTQINKIKTFRLNPTSGWGVMEDIAESKVNTKMDGLSLALNSEGSLLAVWSELDATNNKRLLSATQKINTAWPRKELIKSFTAAQSFTAVATIHENGFPWYQLGAYLRSFKYFPWYQLGAGSVSVRCIDFNFNRVNSGLPSRSNQVNA